MTSAMQARWIGAEADLYDREEAAQHLVMAGDPFNVEVGQPARGHQDIECIAEREDKVRDVEVAAVEVEQLASKRQNSCQCCSSTGLKSRLVRAMPSRRASLLLPSASGEVASGTVMRSRLVPGGTWK